MMSGGQAEGEKLRIGLIGTGSIGHWRAMALRRLSERASLVAIADPDSAATDLVIDSLGASAHIRTFDDGERLASDPEIDAVILSTPPHLHGSLGLACLESGKHLLCEKPLATTLEDAEALVDASESRGLTLSTGFTLRHTRAARRARHLVDSGRLGEVDHIRSFHGHDGAELHATWQRDPKTSGGGTLMDNGIHAIDLARWFLGDTRETQGYGTGRISGERGIEDNGFILLKSTEGRVATVQSSWTEWRGYGYRLEIYCSQGYVRFGYPPMWLTWATREPGRRSKTRFELFPGYQVAERLRGWQWGLMETLEADLRGWIDSIAGQPSATASGRDGLEAVRIALAIERLEDPP